MEVWRGVTESSVLLGLFVLDFILIPLWWAGFCFVGVFKVIGHFARAA